MDEAPPHPRTTAGRLSAASSLCLGLILDLVPNHPLPCLPSLSVYYLILALDTDDTRLLRTYIFSFLTPRPFHTIIASQIRILKSLQIIVAILSTHARITSTISCSIHAVVSLSSVSVYVPTLALPIHRPVCMYSVVQMHVVAQIVQMNK